ncbi:MAG: hypothetical protein ACYC75_02150 [Minisyncoccota bacterium]
MSALYAFVGRVVLEVIDPIIRLLAAAAFILFIWGVFEFIAHAGDATKREEGRKAILWGLVGLVVIFGAYGIINIGITTFNLSPNNQSTIQGVLHP